MHLVPTDKYSGTIPNVFRNFVEKNPQFLSVIGTEIKNALRTIASIHENTQTIDDGLMNYQVEHSLVVYIVFVFIFRENIESNKSICVYEKHIQANG